ncbi:MAG: putative branched-chain amino acid transport ATP-binding protein LivG [Candidatus Heimdallarchaeota archaeon LC_2]|nr:MAG: putative branched-chain amino acid transport ATP-binding protein LivG [Candidatus Heimdallarchaeota archaeon LC_2]
MSSQEKKNLDNDFIFSGEKVYKYFGGVKALDGATISVQKGRLTSLIGPNGSGKSTFFNVITGFLEGDEKSGKINFKSENIGNEIPENIALKGMVRTFQHTRNFPKLTVLENMLISPQDQAGESVIWAFLGKRLWKRQDARNVKKAIEILGFLEIGHVVDHLADELSGGQQKLLAIGRLLMTEPSLLLLDEPVAGVNPTLANKIFDRIIELKDTQGIDILLIEHNMDVIMAFSDEIFVLADGKVIAQGPSSEIQANKQVLEAYLGESPHEA